MQLSQCRGGFLLFFLVTSLVGCQSSENSRAWDRTQPALVIVSNMMHPPFSSRDESGTVVGLEVDLVAQAARGLGRGVEWSEQPFSELIAMVARGEADVAAATIGITEERKQLVAFTEPYFTTTIIALVRIGEQEPKSLDQLRGRRVATDRGTTAVQAARQRIPRALRVMDRPEGRTWAQMLTAGEIDAIVLDHSHAEKFMTDAGTRFHLIEEPLAQESFALVVHKNANELRRQLNLAIAQHLAGATTDD